MKLYVGTSGYSYPEWKGYFYPEDLPQGEMLRYYGERLPSVEINNTFYRLPKASVLEGWAGQVPAEFRFSLKASQKITHIKRLKNASEETDYIFKTIGAMGEKLGVVLFQCPPNLKKDLPRLADFLKTIPAGIKTAFEFRHATWFDDETFACLRDRNCALCIADTDEELQVPFVSTGTWGYLRLRRPDYKKADLQKWREKVESQPWEEAFVFFKHEDEGVGAKFAMDFLKMETGGEKRSSKKGEKKR